MPPAAMLIQWLERGKRTEKIGNSIDKKGERKKRKK